MSTSEQSGGIPPRAGTSALRLWNLEPREGAILAGILVATALFYLPSLHYGWVLDDWDQIVRSVPLHSWTGIGKSFIYDSWWFLNPARHPISAYYRPLQASWFGLNYMILGDHPAAWHLEKIVLQLIAVMLSFRLAQLLTGSSTVALLTAGFFGLLPANAESVVWPSAIGEPLATIFELGALCCLINRKPGWSRGLTLALLLYAGAMLPVQLMRSNGLRIRNRSYSYPRLPLYCSGLRPSCWRGAVPTAASMLSAQSGGWSP